MAEGEILEEEEVTREEEVIREEEEAVETQPPLTTNYQGNNPRCSTGTERNQKLSCRNGRSTGASIDLPHK